MRERKTNKQRSYSAHFWGAQTENLRPFLLRLSRSVNDLSHVRSQKPSAPDDDLSERYKSFQTAMRERWEPSLKKEKNPGSRPGKWMTRSFFSLSHESCWSVHHAQVNPICPFCRVWETFFAGSKKKKGFEWSLFFFKTLKRFKKSRIRTRPFDLGFAIRGFFLAFSQSLKNRGIQKGGRGRTEACHGKSGN